MFTNLNFNPIVVLQDKSQWITYTNRWSTSWIQNGGEPLRYPCLITSITYESDNKLYIKHVFAYEEIVIAYKKAFTKKRKDRGIV